MKTEKQDFGFFIYPGNMKMTYHYFYIKNYHAMIEMGRILKSFHLFEKNDVPRLCLLHYRW
jgi:hypothetical protein